MRELSIAEACFGVKVDPFHINGRVNEFSTWPLKNAYPEPFDLAQDKLRRGNLGMLRLPLGSLREHSDC